MMTGLKTGLLLLASSGVTVVTSFAPTASSFVSLLAREKIHHRMMSSVSIPTSLRACEFDYALIFDCDGVIIETEELHRLAYNAAFKAADVQVNGEPVEWSVEYYDILQNTVGGGKPKMFFHFRETLKSFPEGIVTEEDQQKLIDGLQENKTNLYKQLVSEKAVPRPGVIELMDEALADPKIAVGVCSASTKAAVTKVLDVTLGEERRKKLNVCLLGDDVSKLKPDPLIYSTAAERLSIDPSKCVVVEDSIVGLKAAKGAGMKCLITYTKSTESEDFYGQGADAKVPELGSRSVDLESIFGPMRASGTEDVDILVGKKD
uniref:Uncharacterized protein n=1 Tax=Leptocylindrus danicus TaxID=163516 RepID=A0A7S2KE82_9STRA|mmetsp:Transcript_21858/g.32751  ORF Transcript_21858/g.32751 Transcript_21858/m.32751 type:complete len:319 (+) Transcript_21858:59-1015(+)